MSVLLVALTSACSESDRDPVASDTSAKPERSPSPSPSPSAPGSSDVVEDGEASEIVSRSVAAMASEPITDFVFEVRLDGDQTIVIDGFTQASAWKVTGRFFAPGSSFAEVMYALSVGDQVWMQMRGWPAPAAGCWLAFNEGIPLGIQALTPGEPAYVSLLEYLSGSVAVESAPNTLAGDLDLSAAFALLQAQLFEYIEIDLDRASTATVPVEITYEGQRITSVKMSGQDVITSIEDAGGVVSSSSRTALEVSDFRVSYPPPTTTGTADLIPPPTDLVMTDPASGCN